jgi:hypothetical protein
VAIHLCVIGVFSDGTLGECFQKKPHGLVSCGVLSEITYTPCLGLGWVFYVAGN